MEAVSTTELPGAIVLPDVTALPLSVAVNVGVDEGAALKGNSCAHPLAGTVVPSTVIGAAVVL